MHFEISQHQQNNNLLIFLVVVGLLLIVTFVLFCIRQNKKPIYSYRKDFNSGVMCYMVEKRHFIFYVPLKHGLCFHEYEAYNMVSELNNKLNTSKVSRTK